MELLIAEPEVQEAFMLPLQEVRLLPIGDLQVGTTGFNKEKFKEYIEWGQNIGAYYIGLGDYSDVASPSNRAVMARAFVDLYESPQAAIDAAFAEQLEEVKECLKPTIGRWFGLVSGHHYWCVDEDTEALTRDGWSKDISPGDEILTYDPLTEKQFFAPVSSVFRKSYNGPMWNAKAHRVTPGHRWLGRTKNSYPWKEWVFGESAPTRLNVPVCGKTDDREETIPDSLVQLVGWVLTDGSIIQREHGFGTRIFQSYTANLDKCKLIESIPGATSWYDDNKGMRRYHVSDKRVQEAFESEKRVKIEWLRLLSKRQLHLLFETMVLGDGSTKDGRSALVQKGRSGLYRLEALQAGYIEAGIPSVISRHDEQQWSFYLKAYPTEGFSPIIEPSVETEVWCPTTETGFWIARRNGRVVVTGNSFMDGTTTDTRLAEFLKTKYMGDGAAMSFLRFEDEDTGRQGEVKIYFQHGEGGATTPGGALAKLLRIASVLHSHVYLQGHLPIKISTQLPFIDLGSTKGGNFVDRTHQRTLAVCGGWMESWKVGSKGPRGVPEASYAERGMMPPVSLGGSMILIQPKMKGRRFSVETRCVI